MKHGVMGEGTAGVHTGPGIVGNGKVQKGVLGGMGGPEGALGGIWLISEAKASYN